MNGVPWWLASNAVVVAVLFPAVWLACQRLHSRPAVQHLLWLLLMGKLIAPSLVAWPWNAADLAKHVGVARTPVDPDTSKLAKPRCVAADTLVYEIPLSNDIGELTANSAVAPGGLLRVALADEPPVGPESNTLIAHELHREGPSLVRLAVGVWALGVATAVVLALRGIARQCAVLRHAAVAPSALEAAVRRVAARLRVRPVRTVVSARVRSPALCCFGGTRLVWPTAWSNPEGVAARDGIIAHELAHVARWDHRLTYLELLVMAIHWWNPLAWLIRRQLRETRELACDALALTEADQSRSDYARRLLALATGRSELMVLAPAFGAGTVSRRFLKRRLTMIFDPRTSGRLSAGGLVLAGVLAAIALPAFSWGQGSADGADEAAAPIAQDVALEVVAASSDAPPAPEGAAEGEVTVSTDVAPAAVSNAIVTVEAVADDESSNRPVTVARNVLSTATTAPPAERVEERIVLRQDQLRTGEWNESPIAGGAGAIRVTRDDQGNLVIVVVQTGGRSEDVVHTDGASIEVTTSERPVAGKVPVGFSARPRLTTRYVSAAPAADAAPASAAVRYGATAVADATLEDYKSDVALAEVTLKEKATELEIAREERVSPGKLRLAELAVQRAQIELERATRRLERAPTLHETVVAPAK